VADPDEPDRSPIVVTEVFPTITSPVFSELVITHSGYFPDHLPQDAALLETLRKVHEVRPFKLVFLFEVSPILDTREELGEALDVLTARGLLGFLDSKPTIRTTWARHNGHMGLPWL